MKQVVLRIDDAAFEKFMGMVSLCPMVEVLNVCERGDKKLTTDTYVPRPSAKCDRRWHFVIPATTLT